MPSHSHRFSRFWFLLQQFSLLQLASISATRSRYAAGTSAAILRTIICNRIPQQPLSNQQKLTPTTEARRHGDTEKTGKANGSYDGLLIRESAAPQGAADSSPARSRGERQRAEGQVPGKGSIHELHTAVGRSAAKGGAIQKERPASLVFNARVGPLSIIRSP